MEFIEELGIKEFDEKVGGIPPTHLNAIETPDHRSGLILLGQYIYNGLVNNEQCALITFEDPVFFIDYFSNTNMDFHPYLDSGQLKILNFNPAVSMEIGLRQNYIEVFEEIIHLSGKNTRRVAINQIDALFSLHNHTLINSCAQKIASAASKYPQTILGQYIQFNDDVHYNLSVALHKVAASFLSLKRAPGKSDNDYLLQTKKMPWSDYDSKPIPLHLDSGAGLVSKVPAAA